MTSDSEPEDSTRLLLATPNVRLSLASRCGRGVLY